MTKDAGVSTPGLDDEDNAPLKMWDTPVLAHIRQAAQARDIPEIALLAATLTVLSSEIHPRVILPDVGKGPGNLNVFIALVARSGGGKTSTIRAAQDLIHRSEAKPINPSSGEGLLDAYRVWTTVRVPKMGANGKVTLEPERRYLWKHRSCFMKVDEVGTLEGVTQRRGSTLVATLNTAWSGSSLLTTTADPLRNRDIPGGEYRLAGVVGVQDNATEVLLGDKAERGTAQRFLFAKTTFPSDYEYPDGVEWPGILNIDLPEDAWVDHERDAETTEDLDVTIDGVPISEPVPDITLRLPKGIAEECRRRTRESQRDGSEDPLDGHRAYTQMKLSGLLALLHSRLKVTLDDWARAGRLMQLSENLVELLRAIEQGERMKAIEAAGRMDFRRLEAGDSERIRNASLTLSKVVLRHQHDKKHTDGCTRRCLKDGVRATQRPFLPEAIIEAISKGWVNENLTAAYSASGHTGVRYVPGEKKPGK